MKGVGRNDLCPCGSGKKYKKCCMNKNPRKKYIYVGFHEPFQGVTFEKDKIFIHRSSGDKQLADAVLSQQEYTRKSGKGKVAYSIGGKAISNINSVFSNYDRIYVIDTDTKQIKGEMISISSILECYPKLKNDTNQIELIYRINGNMIFRNCPNNDAERYAWARLIAMIILDHNYNNDIKIALVTDHDLNKHYQYNKRELPIYENIYLPKNIEIIYASADTRNDSILNNFVAICDKNASSILGLLEESGTTKIGNIQISLNMINIPPPISDDPLLSRLKG